jgi:hypothetical protein
VRASGGSRAELLRAVALALALTTAAGACASSRQEEGTADIAASTAVSFRSSDGVKLAGRVFGDGRVGVVLAHMFPADQTSWWAFARFLAPRGFTVLTFDFPADRTVLGNVTAAKLFVAGNADPTGAATAAQAMYDESPPPKQVEIVTSSDHGTDLLTGNQSGRVQTLIIGYLEQHAGA